MFIFLKAYETANCPKLLYKHLLAFTLTQSMTKNWSHSINEVTVFPRFMPVHTTDSENVFFTQIFLTDDDGDDERWRKPLLKSEFMLFPSSLPLFLVVQLIKCKWIFLELNPKGLCLCWLKSSTRREIRQFLVVSGAVKALKCTKSVIRVHSCCFANAYCFFGVPVAVPYLSPVHTNTSIDWRPHYRRFDAFPTVHTKTFENGRITCDVCASYKHKHMRYFSHRFHFDAFFTVFDYPH